MDYKECFEILEISPEASEGDIKKAYKEACQMYHPDANVGKSPQIMKKFEEKMKLVNEAYSVAMEYAKLREQTAREEAEKAESSKQEHSQYSDFSKIFEEAEREKRREEERRREGERIHAEQERRRVAEQGEKLANELLAKFEEQKQTSFIFSYRDSVREVINNQVVIHREAERHPIEYDDGTIIAAGEAMNLRLKPHGLKVVCTRSVESNDPGSNKWEYTHRVLLGDGSSYNRTDKAEGSYYRHEKTYNIITERILPNDDNAGKNRIITERILPNDDNAGKNRYGDATASFWLGIIGVFCAPIVSPFALILGIIGLKKTSTKKGSAVAGIVMGSIGTLILLFFIVIYILLFFTYDSYLI